MNNIMSNWKLMWNEQISRNVYFTKTDLRKKYEVDYLLAIKPYYKESTSLDGK